jgi:hypothetical protein
LPAGGLRDDRRTGTGDEDPADERPEGVRNKLPSAVRHIHLEFGALTLDYQASAAQAQQVADALTRHSDSRLIVTVDDNVRADLPPLPCAGLWD